MCRARHCVVSAGYTTMSMTELCPPGSLHFGGGEGVGAEQNININKQIT